MPDPNGTFELTRDHWFAWQMVPGYVGTRCVPYCSPILVHKIEPLKTGKRMLRLDFFNAFYAEGVQGFSKKIKILKRTADWMFVDFVDDEDRGALISHIEFGWIEKFCPTLWHNYPPATYGGAAEGSVSIYLHQVFKTGKYSS